MGDSSIDKDWHLPDEDAFADMRNTLERAGLTVPVLPSNLLAGLRRSVRGWAWGTDPELSPWSVYSINGELFPSPIPLCLEHGRPDFWMFGHRGYGVNSMGAGLLARQGPLFVFQQHPLGGGYMDPELTTARLNAASMVWAETAARLETMPPSDLRVAVWFSAFRNIADVWIRSPESEEADQDRLVPRGWRSLLKGPPEHRMALLRLLRLDDDPVLALAAEHLLGLLEWRWQAPSPSTERSDLDLPAVEYEEGESLRRRGVRPLEEPQIIQPRPPGDDPDSRVGLDELVEAILHPHYSDGADWTYWRRLVDLSCVVFGLEGRTRHLEEALRNIRATIVPMSDYLEVPREVAAGFRAIPHYYERTSALKEQMMQLQREFFRGVLLALDPDIERKSTTVGRLRQLGLPERNVTDWDLY